MINLRLIFLLIDPRVEAALPVSRALREPQCNFLGGTFNRVTSMDNIPAQNVYINYMPYNLI